MTAVRVITSDHVAIGNVLAEAVGFFHLVAHALYLVEVGAELVRQGLAGALGPATRAALSLRAVAWSTIGRWLVGSTHIELLDSEGQVRVASTAAAAASSHLLLITLAPRPCWSQFWKLSSLSHTITIIRGQIISRTWTNRLLEEQAEAAQQLSILIKRDFDDLLVLVGKENLVRFCMHRNG